MPKGNLHEYAVQAEANLEKLATGLAQAGAGEDTVDAVEQMADMARKIVKALGAGQEQTGDEEPAEAEEEIPEEEGGAPSEDPYDEPTRQMTSEAAAKRQEA